MRNIATSLLLILAISQAFAMPRYDVYSLENNKNNAYRVRENFRDLSANKQDASSAVNTYADQTISGEKTFSEDVTVEGDLTVNGNFIGDGSQLTSLPSQVPSGSITMYGGASAPTGWLICDGSAVSRETYAALFTAIGTAFGTGDGSTTFNLPDMRDNFAIGKSDTKALAATGGEATHTLTTAEMPVHSHNTAGWGLARKSIAGESVTTTGLDSGSAGTELDIAHNAGDMPNAGSGNAHNNLPPYVVLNFIIKA